MIEAAALPASAPRHVAWLVDGPIETQGDGTLTSPMASVRYRCLAPARELSKRGVQCSLFSNLGHADPAAIARELQQRQVELVITGKPLGPAMVEAANKAPVLRR